MPPPLASVLEAVRRLLDPEQFRLIPAHVTLCREGELNNLSSMPLASRLASPEAKPITLRFGRPESFSHHGVLLPCVAGMHEFHELRRWVLGTSSIGHQEPHITLAHPRNPRAPNNNMSNAATLPMGLAVTFTSVCLIRQEGSSPWEVLEQHSLTGAKHSDA